MEKKTQIIIRKNCLLYLHVFDGTLKMEFAFEHEISLTKFQVFCIYVMILMV